MDSGHMGEARERLVRLHVLSSMIMESELSALRKISRSHEQVEKEIERLRRAISARMRQRASMQDADASASVNHDSCWLRWQNYALGALNMQLAEIRADMAKQKEVAARAFGRAEILAKYLQERS